MAAEASDKLLLARGVNRATTAPGGVYGKKLADVVLHDTDRPEWRPLLNVMNQLVWSADGRGVHTVFVDGQKVVEDGRMTTIDEDNLYTRCQEAGEAVVGRSGLPDKAKFPVW